MGHWTLIVSLAAAWLACGCLRWQRKPKLKQKNSSSCLDNLQH